MRFDPVTRAAWEVLLRDSTHTLPVKPAGIARRKGFFVFTYPQYLQATGRSLEELVRRYGPDGFTLRIRGYFAIFYNPTNPIPRIRWTLAHELGHILLGHADEASSGQDRGEEEQQADRFAAELLCPGVLAHLSGADSPAGLAARFDLSAQAAGIQWEKLTRRRQEGAFSKTEQELPKLLEKAFASALQRMREEAEDAPAVLLPLAGQAYGRL